MPYPLAFLAGRRIRSMCMVNSLSSLKRGDRTDR